MSVNLRRLAKRGACSCEAGCDSLAELSPALAGNEKGRPCMQDALMLLFTVIFFALAFLYVKACQKLR